MFFDYEKDWCQKKRENFTFKYAYLEGNWLNYIKLKINNNKSIFANSK